MCLILFAINPDPSHHLIVAANRDEFHARASAPADYWQNGANSPAKTRILAGRDRVANGTWLGVSSGGRFAAVTNFAEAMPCPMPPLSRGKLTSDFLQSEQSIEDYLVQIDRQRDQFRGFNLLLSDGARCFYYSNRQPECKPLGQGYYGLSNQLLDCHWPKVNQGRKGLASAVRSTDALFELLGYSGDGTAHSARFIVGESYGTRSSTVVYLGRQLIRFEERNFDARARATTTRKYQLGCARRYVTTRPMPKCPNIVRFTSSE